MGRLTIFREKGLLDTPLLLILRHVFGGKLLLELHWGKHTIRNTSCMWPQNINTEIEHDACLLAAAYRDLPRSYQFGFFSRCYSLTVEQFVPSTLIWLPLLIISIVLATSLSQFHYKYRYIAPSGGGGTSEVLR